MRNNGSARADAVVPTTAADEVTTPAAGARTAIPPLPPPPPSCPSGGVSRARTCPETTVSPGSTSTWETCKPSRSGRTRTSFLGTSTPLTCSVSAKHMFFADATVTAISEDAPASRSAAEPCDGKAKTAMAFQAMATPKLADKAGRNASPTQESTARSHRGRIICRLIIALRICSRTNRSKTMPAPTIGGASSLSRKHRPAG